MRLSITSAIAVLLLGIAPAVSTAAQPEVPHALTRLAAQANRSRIWPALRHYAQSQPHAQEQAAAYFVLGYREYESGNYEAAEKDLGAALPSNFALADLDQYYYAAAAYKAGHPEKVVKTLGGFSALFPRSPVRYKALELLAWGYLQNGETQLALKALQAGPEVRQRPALALLLAQAYLDNGSIKSAARAYQEVYYAFPTTPQASVAGATLKKLRLRLGVNFPSVSDEIATARVEKLYAAYHYTEALKGYKELLKARQGSSWAWRWGLGRAQCLVAKGHADEAIETLVGTVAPTPDIDAQRLAILVHAYLRTGNETAAAKSVNQLQSNHLRSHWHAVALLDLANFLLRHGNQNLAELYYRTLTELFPQTPQGLKASWRLGWVHYLAGDSTQARKQLLAHIKNYPQSPHVPAAIYYYAKLEEEPSPSRARALYTFLVRRYVHNYYAVEAANRLRALPIEPAWAAGSRSGLTVAELESKLPRANPPDIQPCRLERADPNLRAFDMLRALHLEALAAQDIRARLVDEPSSSPLLLALSRLQAHQGKYDLALRSAKKIVPSYYSTPFSVLPREIWNLLFPTAFAREIKRRAALNHLAPYLVMALIRQESGFNSRATSPSGARGLMQILPSTAARSRRSRRTVAQRLYNPAYNVRFGCAYLHELLKRFKGNLPEALAAYNAGPTRVSQWISAHSYRDSQEFVESIPFTETRIYVKAVLKDRAVYRQLLARRVHFAECRSPSRRRP